MLNFPNLFSIARVVLLIPFIYFLRQESYGLAFTTLVLAGLTDALDGAMARPLHQRTVLGAYLDPAADKVLMTCSYIALASFGLLPWWLTLLVIGGWSSAPGSNPRPTTLHWLSCSKCR